MKKIITKICICMLLLFCLPTILFACGEQKFEDVPYTQSGESSSQVVAKINNSKAFMLNSLELKMSIKTTNTYQFIATDNGEVANKIVRDEISTIIGTPKTNPMVSTVEKTRYINNKKVSSELSTYYNYIKDSDVTISYCYTLSQTYLDGVLNSTTKSRTTYDSGYINSTKLFSDVFLTINSGEIDSIYTKSFEGTNYYKLVSTLSGIEQASARFTQNANLQNQPELFQAISPNYDTILPFGYECGISDSGYINYFILNYSISNQDRQVYLKASSKSTLSAYGDSVLTLTQPKNADDYTVESFVNTFNKEESFVIYKDSAEPTRTQTTVVKLGTINPNYSVKVENYQANSVVNTKYYFLQYTGVEEAPYKAYELNINNLTAQESDFVLDFINFDFTLPFTAKNSNNVYQYGTGTAYINIDLLSGEINSMSALVADVDKKLYVDNYGNNLNGINLVNSLDGFTITSESTGEV